MLLAASSEGKLTVLEGVALVRPAVLDDEWDAVVKLKSDLLGGTSLEAVCESICPRDLWSVIPYSSISGRSRGQPLPLERIVRLETKRKAGQRASVEVKDRSHNVDVCANVTIWFDVSVC